MRMFNIMRIGEKSIEGLDCTLNGAIEFKNYIFVQNLHENYAELTLKANVFSKVAAKKYLYV